MFGAREERLLYYNARAPSQVIRISVMPEPATAQQLAPEPRSPSRTNLADFGLLARLAVAGGASVGIWVAAIIVMSN